MRIEPLEEKQVKIEATLSDVGTELRQMMTKLYELTTYTDLSGEHHARIEQAIKQVLKDRGEEYGL